MPACAICTDLAKRVTHVFEPCGHLGCCASCAEKIFQDTQRRKGPDGSYLPDATNACPWCRSQIAGFGKVQVIV
jgi:hypothetical protein